MFFSIIVAIIIVALLIWLVNEFLPIDPKFKRLIQIVAGIALVFYILKVSGILAYLSRF